MGDECKTKPPPPTVVCSKKCNKCMANTTSRLLYYMLVKKLDERDVVHKRSNIEPIPQTVTSKPSKVTKLDSVEQIPNQKHG